MTDTPAGGPQVNLHTASTRGDFNAAKVLWRRSFDAAEKPKAPPVHFSASLSNARRIPQGAVNMWARRYNTYKVFDPLAHLSFP